MKLKSIKTLIFIMILIVFAAGSIYNYKKPSGNAPEILQFFDSNISAGDQSETSGIHADTEHTTEDPVDERGSSGSGLININEADRAELESLPGIGPVKAKAIIEYRKKYNGFVAPEEIMEVRGIGPVTYEKIKDLITIE